MTLLKSKNDGEIGYFVQILNKHCVQANENTAAPFCSQLKLVKSRFFLHCG